MKRCLDFLMASILIIILLPFFIILIIVYAISGNWPILFIQSRIGLNESTFNLLKFRSLNSNESLPLESRKFGLGNWLRRTSLDELPQLINVIKGEMSLVGPRPLPTNYLPLFSQNQRKRFLMRPGISGLAQVNGGSQLTWEEKFRYDLVYIDQHKLLNDFMIILKTIQLVFTKKDDGLNESPFKG